jgi:hypothetical protein
LAPRLRSHDGHTRRGGLSTGGGLDGPTIEAGRHGRERSAPGRHVHTPATAPRLTPRAPRRSRQSATTAYR